MLSRALQNRFIPRRLVLPRLSRPINSDIAKHVTIARRLPKNITSTQLRTIGRCNYHLLPKIPRSFWSPRLVRDLILLSLLREWFPEPAGTWRGGGGGGWGAITGGCSVSPHRRVLMQRKPTIAWACALPYKWAFPTSKALRLLSIMYIPTSELIKAGTIGRAAHLQ